jgi:pimeloyl-ACP methyl ester carboxylesterase
MTKAWIPKLVGKIINIVGLFNSVFASKVALKIFSKPRNGKLTSHTNLFLKTASTKTTLYFDNIPIQTYHWKGSKKTILLAHGWESNSGRWRHKVQKLHKEGYNIITLDGPAHGGSGSKTFNAILYSEFINVVSKEFKPTAFIGHSVGAMAVVMFLKKQTHYKAEKIVLLGAPSGFIGIMKRYIELMSYNPKISKGINKQIELKFGQPAEYFSTADFIKNIDAKGLIIHDKYDRIIPYRDALDIEAQFKNAKLVTTEGLGHSLKGDFVYKELIKFLSH